MWRESRVTARVKLGWHAAAEPGRKLTAISVATTTPAISPSEVMITSSRAFNDTMVLARSLKRHVSMEASQRMKDKSGVEVF